MAPAIFIGSLFFLYIIWTEERYRHIKKHGINLQTVFWAITTIGIALSILGIFRILLQIEPIVIDV